MSVRDALTLEIAIDSAYKAAIDASHENRSRIAQLMAVWISGYLEVTCRDVLLTYAERRSDESVARFVGLQLRRLRSPNTRAILNLVDSFDESRAKELEKFISQKRIKESIDGVVALRNQIAHGISANTTITNVKIQFDDSRQLAEKLKELFGADA